MPRLLSARDLPGVLRQIGAPLHVRRALLGQIQPGNYSSNDPNIGTYEDGGTDASSVYYASTPADDTSGSQMSIVASTPGDAPGFDGIYYSVINFRAVANDGSCTVPANKNRVLLIVQNQHSTDNMVVNFGQGASIQQTHVVGPPASIVIQATGIIIFPGGNIFIDKYCSTDAVYMKGLNDTNCALCQGTRGPLV
jgi:hypothetical protein